MLWDAVKMEPKAEENSLWTLQSSLWLCLPTWVMFTIPIGEVTQYMEISSYLQTIILFKNFVNYKGI